MTGPTDRSGDKSTREERLAAKLRENLRRRKSQARAMNETEPDPLSKPPSPG